jgi:hypothetical protein
MAKDKDKTSKVEFDEPKKEKLEEPKKEQKPTIDAVKKQPEHPQPEPKPSVALRAFLRMEGSKHDQLAGFAHYAKSKKLGPMPVSEWRVALAEFKKMPA